VSKTTRSKRKRNWPAIGALAAVVLAVVAVMGRVFPISGPENKTDTNNARSGNLTEYSSSPSLAEGNSGAAEPRATKGVAPGVSVRQNNESPPFRPAQVAPPRPDPGARDVGEGSAADGPQIRIGSITSTNQSGGNTGVIFGNVNGGPRR
jgi:hypothetical protein